MDRAGWMHLLDLGEHEVPRLLVVEGTRWRQRALDVRLPLLTGVRELGMPDLWHGWYGPVAVAYCPVYGAARAVEPVHVLGAVGTTNVVHIGPCGGLQPRMAPGDIVLSERAVVGEGASQYYGGRDVAEASLGRVARAAALLAARRTYGHRGTTVTTSALLSQPPDLLREWADAGHLAVDLETSAVLTAARAFRMRAAAMLFVAERLPRPAAARPFPAFDERVQASAGAEAFEVALQLA